MKKAFCYWIVAFISTTSLHSVYADDSEQCEGKITYRQIDGRCNNVQHSERGMNGDTFKIGPEGTDFTPIDFLDENQNGRSLSNFFGATSDRQADDACISNIGSNLGQLLTHDVVDLRVDRDPSGTVQIKVLDSDDVLIISRPPNFPPAENPFIPISRNVYQAHDDTQLSFNDTTAWLDLSPVYGAREDIAHALREHAGGRLLTRDYMNAEYDLNPIHIPFKVSYDLLTYPPSLADINIGAFPGFEDLALAHNFPQDVLASGDPRRGASNIFLASLQVLFVREHNRLAGLFAEQYPLWSDEQLYQAARRINIAQYQHIVMEEWLKPQLLRGHSVSKLRYRGYDPKLNPKISSIFFSSFAFGHTTQLPPKLKDVQYLPLYAPPLDEPFFFGQSGGPGLQIINLFAYSQGLSSPLRSMAITLVSEFDLGVVDELRNIPILSRHNPDLVGIDLLAISHTRSRLMGLPGYYEIRKAYYSPKKPKKGDLYKNKNCYRGHDTDPLACFTAITDDLDFAKTMQSKFKKVTEIPLLIGLWGEKKNDNQTLPKTIANVIIEQFNRLIHSDRFYYEHELNISELAMVNNTSFSDIINRNSDNALWNTAGFAPLPWLTEYKQIACTPGQ